MRPRLMEPACFSRLPSRAHVLALPTPSPGHDTRIEGTNPRAIPIPAPHAIRATHASNSRMGPYSRVRALPAQEFRRGVAQPHRLRGPAGARPISSSFSLSGARAPPPTPVWRMHCVAKGHPPTLLRARRWSKRCWSARTPPRASSAPDFPGWGRAGRAAGPRGRAQEAPGRGAALCGVWALLGSWVGSSQASAAPRAQGTEAVHSSPGWPCGSVGGAGASGRAAARGAICLSGWTPAPNWEILINYLLIKLNILQQQQHVMFKPLLT